ncbi:MAG: hypothetical protein DCF25_16470 [Leptolyngbya foveolarum]|uniref:Uncharacterized protein n=1 Tax=Leptolyngbya foveolarum TaxID=47253 RepID=A0A2W4TWA0_9CYAN|nr:MAG: hypothetical protein DCF25_16470 [Leptolyngbya foveolarum]
MKQVKLPERMDILSVGGRKHTYIDNRLIDFAKTELGLGRGKHWVFWDEVIRKGLEVLITERASSSVDASSN